MHFSTSYDYFKYNGKTRVSESSFIGRKDKYFFERLAKRCSSEEECFNMIWSCFLGSDKNKVYIRDIDNIELKKLQTFSDSFEYKVKDLLEKYLTEKFDINQFLTDMFTNTQEKTTYMFFFCLLDYSVFKNKLSEHLETSENPLFSELSKKMTKHKNFVLSWARTKIPEFHVMLPALVKEKLASK